MVFVVLNSACVCWISYLGLWCCGLVWCLCLLPLAPWVTVLFGCLFRWIWGWDAYGCFVLCHTVVLFSVGGCWFCGLIYDYCLWV